MFCLRSKNVKALVLFFSILAVLLFLNNQPVQAIASSSKQMNDQTEVVDKRTETSKTFKKKDGKTFVTEQYLEPIHVQKNGKWIDIDQTKKENISAKTSDEMIYVEEGKARFGFAKKSDAPQILSFEQGGSKVDFRYIGKDAVPVKQEGNKLSYPGVYPGTDLVYHIDSAGVKEEWKLHRYSDQSTFSMGIQMKDAKPVPQKDGSMQFVDPKGALLFSIPRPFMYDANDASSQEVKLEIRNSGTETYLDIKADEAWLKDPKRVFPITIDPTVGVQGAKSTYDNLVSSKNPTTNYQVFPFLIAGTHADYGATRSFIKFDLPTLIQGAQITGVKFSLHQYSTAHQQPVNLHPVTSSWTSKGITWNEQPSVGQKLNQSIVGGAGEYSWDLTELGKDWYSNKTPNNGISLQYEDETQDRKSFRSSDYMDNVTQRPKLLVTYTIDPQTVSEPNVEAESYIIMDAKTGQQVYGKSVNQPRPPASMTKMMTEFVILDRIKNGKLSWDDTVEVSPRAAGIDESQIELEAGEKMSVRELFMAMAVYSANDATAALAEHVAGTETEFVHEMNQKAKELNLNETHFRNATGLNMTDYKEPPNVDGEHVMSAENTANLARTLLQQHPELENIVSTPQYTFYKGTPREKKVINWNRMLPGLDQFYPGVIGLKTGFTTPAGYCFTGVTEQEGKRFITVVMGTKSQDARFTETKKLLDYAFAKFGK
ncbi:D-alanyl-D-alanine carboxypeptidase [Croceifilum oryzae]|uniref:D-alanyl-D-alanine carboxypeptidase n=1 Tax=Croceifilum oryzae TaxID=1553429 RepID=A0AAJ1WRU3_9BACL|nr:DNRLRE domain-containing protein [Croceifilum oryzae]MDQ0418887.1 D-alanyl-D-alanine carboxypeptidase [Croceifilum oryzae]